MALVYFAAVSTVFWRYRKKRVPLITVALAVSSLYAVSLVPLAVSSTLLGGLRLAVGRWSLFAMPFVAGLTAIYLMMMRSGRLRITLVAGLIVAVNLGVAASSLDINQTWLGNQVGISTDYFKTSEITAADFLIRHSNGTLRTDFVYASLFLYYLNGSPSSVSFDYQTFTSASGTRAVRLEELNSRGLEFISYQESLYKVITVNDDVIASMKSDLGTRFYDSGTVVATTS